MTPERAASGARAGRARAGGGGSDAWIAAAAALYADRARRAEPSGPA